MNVVRLLASLAFPILALVAEEGSYSKPIKMAVERLDPAMDELVAANTKIEKLAEGFLWSEGPTWFEGSVVFSDVPDNVIYRWKPNEASATVFMKPSGLFNPSPGFRQPGSNGLAVDADGRLLICQQGERRVARVEKSGVQTTIAAKFNGKRFNSPNDLAIRKNGDVYLTDPPYGLANLNDSPLKEQPHNGGLSRRLERRSDLAYRGSHFPQRHRLVARREDSLRDSKRSERTANYGL